MPISEAPELDEYGPPVAKVAKYSHFPHEVKIDDSRDDSMRENFKEFRPV